ncbi:hypothetical protein KCP69_06650 [Salmonella enterica subsp. enterica]|nr:hypothetical protein KCP69_06650 [Salmonella enterica subsp. enterica]
MVSGLCLAQGFLPPILRYWIAHAKWPAGALCTDKVEKDKNTMARPGDRRYGGGYCSFIFCFAINLIRCVKATTAWSAPLTDASDANRFNGKVESAVHGYDR